jgi:two-component system chemotaxis response regulator CheY
MNSILAVDDSVSLRKLLSATLRHHGFEVIEAENGKDALKKLENNAVDMIITDINMPVMNGFELAEAVRQQKDLAHLPILALTTEASKDKRRKGLDKGMTAWMVKPFQCHELLRILKRLCH